jgi:hypothetical protein
MSPLRVTVHAMSVTVHDETAATMKRSSTDTRWSALELDVLARSTHRCRPALHGHAPSISTSSEKLNTIRINTMSPKTPTLSRGLVHQDRPDDVSHDQHLESEQYHWSEVRPQLSERVGCVRGGLLHVASEGDEPADDHDRATDALYDFYHLASDSR